MGRQGCLRRRFGASTALLSLTLLAACGGGGSSGGGAPISTPAPPPAPTPAPAPTPTPTPNSAAAPAPAVISMPPRVAVPTAFNTAEFRRSDGPGEHNAVVAWNSGRTGKGVTIAVVDTGVDANSPEFAGRISPLSRDMTGSGRSISGSDDHGTNVALVAAAARDGVGIVGMAYDATVMALRTDDVGSCAADNPTDSDADCFFSDDTISRALAYASTNGAKVINLSLGGEGATVQVQNAARDAVARGALLVLSAGNEGLAEPESFARLIDQAGGGGVLIVGSVNADGTVSSFSNKAGSQTAHYIAALGNRVCCTYENGKLYVDAEGYTYLMSGTSFSAPQVSGAAALLAQAFPNLTGRQIAEILLKSAFDAGAPGPDAAYGQGILDLTRAFQPLGTTSLAGGTTALALGDGTGAGSVAMGDALTTAALPAVVLDEYGRAFESDLAGTLRGAAPAERLRNALGTQQRSVSMSSERVSVAFAIDASDPAELPLELRLGREDAEQARVLAGRIAAQLNPNLKLGFAYAESADGLVAQLQGQDRPAFLIAPEAAGDDGMFRRADASLAVRRKLGSWGLTASAERGETLTGAPIRRASELAGHRLSEDTATYGLAIDRRFGDLDAVLGASWVVEDETLLGARFHDAFGLAGANTLFLDARAGWHVAPRWRLGAAVRQGWTTARSGGLVASGSALSSRAWSFDVERQGLFSDADSLAVRVSQPLRVESGSLNLTMPTGYSYETLLADYGVRSLALAPHGREIMGEVAWRGPLLSGTAAASLFYRQDPGHYQALPADKGLAFRWSRRF